MQIVSSRLLTWVAVAALGAPGAHAAEWSVQPVLSVSTDYDSNRTLAPNAIGSDGVSMSGNMRLEHATERLRLALLPDIELQRFSDRQFNRSDSGGLTTQAVWSGELSSLDLTALLRDQSTLASELTSTGIIDLHTRRRDEEAGGTWSYSYAPRWIASLSASYQAQDYHGNATTPLQDSKFTSFAASEKYIVSDRLALTASLSTGRYTTQQSFFDTRSNSASLGFLWSSSERNRFSGEFGWNRRTDRFTSSSGFVGQMAFTRAWEAGSFALSAGRSEVPSGFGVFSQTDQADLNASRNLSERVTLGAGVGWYRTTSAFQTLLFDKHSYSQAHLSLSWWANEYWSISLQAQADRQDEPLQNSQGHGWRAGLSATWQPLKHSLSR